MAEYTKAKFKMFILWAGVIFGTIGLLLACSWAWEGIVRVILEMNEIKIHWFKGPPLFRQITEFPALVSAGGQYYFFYKDSMEMPIVETISKTLFEAMVGLVNKNP